MAELLKQGGHHLEFVCTLRPQVERGGHVLFEHLLAATSWNEPCLKKLLAIDGMRRVRCDQCQFGMTSVDHAGNVVPARMATGFMTNDEYIAEAVGTVTFSVPRLVAAIRRALRQSMRAAGCGEARRKG